MEVNLTRLCNSINHAGKVTAKQRALRHRMIQEYAGADWSENAAPKEVPVNVIDQMVSIYQRNLVSKFPRCMLATFKKPHKPVVSAMQYWANEEIDRQNFYDVEQRVVMDALFWFGVSFCGIATPSDAAMANWGQEAGFPYLCWIDPDDFRIDPHARHISHARWMRAPIPGSARNRQRLQDLLEGAEESRSVNRQSVRPRRR